LDLVGHFENVLKGHEFTRAAKTANPTQGFTADRINNVPMSAP
jgi:hypothetical protein